MSRFTSGGTNDAPIERDAAWLAAQREIEAKRAATQAQGQQADGKSLYETLQANKAAKQEAFEESIRLKNQFRTLDDDEIGFLDSVLEADRAREDAVRKETREGVERFRREKEERERLDALLATGEGTDGPVIAKGTGVDGAGPSSGAAAGGMGENGMDWKTVGRKRKRGNAKENTLGLLVKRRASGIEKEGEAEGTQGSGAQVQTQTQAQAQAQTHGLGGPGGNEKLDDSGTASDATSKGEVAESIDRHEEKATETLTNSNRKDTTKAQKSGGLGLDDYSSDDD